MILDMSFKDIARAAQTAQSQTGRPVVRQLVDMVRLRLGKGKLSAREYFDYRLFEPQLSDEDRKAFAGRWIRHKVYPAQDPQWCGLGNDKLLSYLYLNAIGLPVAPIRAIYDERRYHPGAALLSSPEACARWLRDPANYPVFIKPANGAFGVDATYAAALDADAQSIVTINGEKLPIDAFVQRHWRRHVGGLLMQEIIRLHPNLAERIGERVATARIMTMQSATGPRVHRAVFRIPTGKNFTDNFNLGSSGNGFATVDLETGRLTEVYTQIGLNRKRITAHVDTGGLLEGFELPGWRAAVDMVLRGQAALLGLPILGWDIAFTETTPVVVEFNVFPGYALLQAAGRGLMDRDFRASFPDDPEALRKLYPINWIGASLQRKTGKR